VGHGARHALQLRRGAGLRDDRAQQVEPGAHTVDRRPHGPQLTELGPDAPDDLLDDPEAVLHESLAGGDGFQHGVDAGGVLGRLAASMASSRAGTPPSSATDAKYASMAPKRPSSRPALSAPACMAISDRSARRAPTSYTPDRTASAVSTTADAVSRAVRARSS